MSCHDHECTKSISFSAKYDKLITITQKGLFCVWSIANLNRLSSRHFKRETLSMIVCKNDPKIIIAFEDEVILFLIICLIKSYFFIKIKVLENKPDFTFDPNWNLKFETGISDVRLSYSEKILAIALAPNSEKNASIELLIFFP